MSAAERTRLLRRAEMQIDEWSERARPILQEVRQRGDEALLEFTERFDRVKLTPDRLRVSRAEIEHAHQVLDRAVREAIEGAIGNVRAFHTRQMPHEEWFTEVAPGVMAGEKITPISSVGLYVPRGKGAFPSVMYMLATPASIAGVPRIVSVHHLDPVEKWTRLRWGPLTCVESMKYIVLAARRRWPRWPMEQTVFVACIRLQGLAVAL